MGEQHTVARTVAFGGVGLHSGRQTRAEVRPAPPDHGLWFHRADLPGSEPIPADLDAVVATDLATTLGRPGGPEVATVEHLIAACVGLGIDNAEVHVDGGELPVLDGSAAEFAAGLLGGGIARQGVRRRRVVVLSEVSLHDARTGRRASLLPDPGFSVECEIAFDHPALASGRYRFVEGDTDFLGALAGARTFGLLREVEAMRARGLALGGSLRNAVVFGDEGVVNPEGLRWPDEPARHKTLDALGDLALLGGRLRGRLVASRSGHAWNLALMREARRRGAVVREGAPLPLAGAGRPRP